MKRKTKRTRSQVTTGGDKSLMGELDLIHVRIEGILARTKDKGGPSDRDWEQIWKLVDRKIRLVEADTKRQLAHEKCPA